MKKTFGRYISLLLCMMFMSNGFLDASASAKDSAEPPQALTNQLDQAEVHIVSELNSILDSTSGMTDSGQEQAPDTWQVASEAVASFCGTVGDSVRSGMTDALNWASNLADQTGSWISDVWRAGIDGISSFSHDIADRVSSVADSAVEAITTSAQEKLQSLGEAMQRYQLLGDEWQDICNKTNALVTLSLFTVETRVNPVWTDAEAMKAINALQTYVNGEGYINNSRMTEYTRLLKQKAIDYGFVADARELKSKQDVLVNYCVITLYLSANKYLFRYYQDEAYLYYASVFSDERPLSKKGISDLLVRLNDALDDDALLEGIAEKGAEQNLSLDAIVGLLPVDTEDINQFYSALNVEDRTKLLAWANDNFAALMTDSF